jgi:hypothetical protein
VGSTFPLDTRNSHPVFCVGAATVSVVWAETLFAVKMVQLAAAAMRIV